MNAKHIRLFRLSPFGCSTAESGSQREKLSLKTEKIERVGLDLSSALFFIYATLFRLRGLPVGRQITDYIWLSPVLRPVLPKGENNEYGGKENGNQKTGSLG